MGNTYNQWLKLATQQIAEIKRTVGIDMIKVEADPEQFAAWCKVNSCAPDGRSRSAYAGVKYGESRKISEN